MGETSDSRANRSAALLLCVMLSAFAALHAYWALGGSWGLETAVGPGLARPSAGPIWGMAVAQALFAYAAFVVARAPGNPPLVARGTLWVLAAGAALVGCLNIAMGTRAAERFGIGPLAIGMTLLALYAVRRPRRARTS